MTANELRLDQIRGFEKKLDSIKWLFFLGRTRQSRIRHMLRYGTYWNSADVDNIANSFSDNGFVYRDNINPMGISDKSALKKYFTDFFSEYPCQIWTIDADLFSPLEGSMKNKMSLFYRFKLFKDFDSPASEPDLSGTGMEMLIFDQNCGNISKDYLHLVFDQEGSDRLNNLSDELKSNN